MKPAVMKIKIPYGKGYLKLSLPRSSVMGILKNKSVKAKSVERLLKNAMDNPIGAKRLEAIAKGKKSILVVVPDATRKVYLREMLPHIIKRFGRPVPGRVTIMVATGLHKRHSRDQLKDLVGDTVVKHNRVVCHTQDRESLIDCGRTNGGIPIVLNRCIREHDLIVSVGAIEPHLYAGYSGGAKTIAIGLAGEATISATHSARFLDDPRTKLGSVSGNPFQEALWGILSKVRIGFTINIVNDSDGRPVNIFAGSTRAVFARGIAFSKDLFEVRAKSEADIVICGIGYPKDINLYQASRAINYITNVNRPVIRKGGVLMVASELKDGPGYSMSEGRFYSSLKEMSSPGSFIAHVKKDGCLVGEHRTYMVAKSLCDYRVVFLGKGRKGFMNDLPFPYFTDIDKAMKYSYKFTAVRPKIYIIPRALSTIAGRS